MLKYTGMVSISSDKYVGKTDLGVQNGQGTLTHINGG